MTPAQNRALRSVYINKIRELDRFLIFLETTRYLPPKTTEGIRLNSIYLRATLSTHIQQLEDQYEKVNP